MNRKDLDALNELYLSVYVWEEVETWVASLIEEGYDLSDYTWEEMYKEYLEEAPARKNHGDPIIDLYNKSIEASKRRQGQVEREKAQQAGDRATNQRAQLGVVKTNKGYIAKPGATSYDPNKGAEAIRLAARLNKETGLGRKPTATPTATPTANPPAVPSTPVLTAASSAGSAPSRPSASGPVLSKKDGVEGTGVGANFKARAFSAAEKSRYASVAAQNAAKSSAASATPNQSPSPSSTPSAPNQSPSPSSTPSAPTPAVGKLGNTSFERRTPTSAELRAAQGARDKGASPEKALQAAQKTNLPTTGPSPAIPDLKSVSADLARANTPANLNRAPAGSAAAKALAVKPATSTPTPSQIASASQGIKPATPGQNSINNKKPTNEMSSYEWPSAKTIRDIAGAYSSIYEAKKKVDQDEDGDTDFGDVIIARMIASGVPKEKAIAMVKDKSYNEEVELWVNELIEEGYDLSEYTWDDMFDIYEATAMTKRGYDETEIRNKIAKSTGGGKFADKATELENRPTFGNKSKQASRERLARTQRGDFRRTTSSDYGLRLGAHKSADPTVKAKQKARGAQRSALTPREKKQLNREAYEAYEFVSSYLLENNFATTVDDANVIINNMSENWFNQIMEG